MENILEQLTPEKKALLRKSSNRLSTGDAVKSNDSDYGGKESLNKDNTRRTPCLEKLTMEGQACV